MEVPFEVFFGFIGVTLTLVAVGLAKGIPALLVFAGMFLLMWVVVTDTIIMGSIPESSTITGNTTNYQFQDNPFPFIEWPKVIFGLFAVVLMLIGALLTKSGADNL